MGFLDTVKGVFRGSSSEIKGYPVGTSAGPKIWGTSMPRSLRDYKIHVTDGLQNSIVLATVQWAARNFPEAEIALYNRQQDDLDWNKELEHDFLDLMHDPNPYYTDIVLWMATVIDWNTSGNAYWIKQRDRRGKIHSLWYTPSPLIEPRGTNDEFITHYDYTVNVVKSGGRLAQETVRLEMNDVVHFRNGIDPQNSRKGLSPLQALFREIFTDDEAANFSSSILANLGVPGVILAPAAIPGMFDTMEIDADQVKRSWNSKFTGDRRGEPLVLTQPMDIKVLTWSPEQLNLTELRRVPEERVSAVIGIPASVVGLGAGLDRNTFTNYKESRSAAYENNIIPTQRIFSAEIKKRILSEFIEESEKRYYKVGFDLSTVRALAEDQKSMYERARLGVGSGMMTISEGRNLMGLSSDESHEVYLRNPNQVVVPKNSGNDPMFIPNVMYAPQLSSGTPAGSDISSLIESEDTPPLPFPELDQGPTKPLSEED